MKEKYFYHKCMNFNILHMELKMCFFLCLMIYLNLKNDVKDENSI